MTKVFLFGAIALVAMGFVACSEESRLGIKKPLVFPTMDNYGKIYYAIQSQDENTAIEDIIVNRGNCGEGLKQYDYDLGLEKQHSKELCDKYKDKGICINVCDKYKDKGICINDGKSLKLKKVLNKKGEEKPLWIYMGEIPLISYNNLNDDFKKLYKKIEPKKLGYGETMKIDIGRCDSSNIMEVQLVLNGGKKVTYNLKGGY